MATLAFALPGVIEASRRDLDAVALRLFAASGAQIGLGLDQPALIG